MPTPYISFPMFPYSVWDTGAMTHEGIDKQHMQCWLILLWIYDFDSPTGMIPFAGTGLLIPAVVGMQIPDPGGSGLQVPILGVESNPATGRLIPLAGTMEDPDGKGI